MKIRTIIMALLLVFGCGVATAAAADLQIFINNERLTIADNLGKPFIDNQSRTQVPLRAISEGLGHEVNWNAATRTVTIINSDKKEIRVTLGSNEVNTPDGIMIMDTIAVIIDGRTYVPLRFVSEALGYSVDYQWKGFHSIT